MIHTIEMYTNISFEEKKMIEKRFNKNIEEVMKDMNANNTSIRLRGKNRMDKFQITLFADITKILNRGEVNDDDYYEVKRVIDEFIENLIGYKLDLVLMRVEYRFDKYISSKAERLILLDIYRKMINKHRFKVKKNYKKYKTSIRYDSKSMQIIIYDKEKEREDKEQECKEYEKCILRFEVKLLNKHLNYNKRKYLIDKDLKNYFSKDMQVKYMMENIQKIVYKGDYYNIREVDKLIINLDMEEKERTFIREFLIDISNNGVSGAKDIINESGKQKYTKYKFKKAMDILENLNINPILIPKSREYLYGERYYFIKNPFEF